MAATDARAAGPRKPLPGNWLSKVRADHPRLFFNKTSWPQVKAYTLKHEGAYYQSIQRLVASMPAQPNRKDCEKGSNKKYGPYAQMAAFVWRMEGDPKALEKARNYLLEGVRFYVRSSSARKTVNWYSASRVCAMTAYDWIYDKLTPDERREVARGFFKHTKDCLSGRGFTRQNRSNYTSGFYGPTNMAWYVGLTFYRDGVDDAEALRLLKKGYAEHVELLDYRGLTAGDDGGAASLAVGYAFGMYPWAEYNFMHTYSSATGLQLERHYDHLSLMANWVFWNYIPGGTSWGLADSVPAGPFHDSFLEMHFLQAAHFYAEQYPDRARFSLWARENLLKSQKHDNYWWPMAPFFLTRCGTLPKAKGPDRTWPLARNFEQMGAVFMRSDWGDSPVSAVLIAGGNVRSHRHYDQGHFVIHHKGYLSLDSGDYGPRERNEHLKEYEYRTVAHNSILIHAPAEADELPKVWGGPPETYDGGQYVQDGRQIAFETNRAYTYAATDMTKCYASKKCRSATRQFVFVRPNTFVICDRITSAKADYRKQWLLHSVNEPTIGSDGKTFRVAHGDGVLEGHVLMPNKCRIEKIGGPGKEFWSAGKNRPQTVKHRELSGAWRVEVSPVTSRTEDIFLTVLRIGESKRPPRGEVSSVSGRGKVGATFPLAGGGKATVLFNARGAIGGHVEVTGKQRIKQSLATKVQKQEGLAAGTSK
jgi:Heparinase II/III-like protein